MAVRRLARTFWQAPDVQTASYSIIAWKASQNKGVADWSDAAMKDAKVKAKQVQKEATQGRLLH